MDIQNMNSELKKISMLGYLKNQQINVIQKNQKHVIDFQKCILYITTAWSSILYTFFNFQDTEERSVQEIYWTIHYPLLRSCESEKKNRKKKYRGSAVSLLIPCGIFVLIKKIFMGKGTAFTSCKLVIKTDLDENYVFRNKFFENFRRKQSIFRV